MTQTKAKTVILDPHPSLHKDSMPADPNSKEIKELITTMRQTLKEWEEGEKRYVSVGLAAVQINKLYRVVLVRSDFDDYQKTDFYPLINPEIIKYEGAPMLEDESCMSVHGIHAKVPRYPKIRVRAQEKALPFEPLVPNEETIKAMEAARRGDLIMAKNVDDLMAKLNADD